MDVALLSLAIGIHWNETFWITDVDLAILEQSCVPKLSLDICSWIKCISLFGQTGEAVIDDELIRLDGSDVIN